VKVTQLRVTPTLYFQAQIN